LQNISGSAANSTEKINFGSIITENCVFFAAKVEMFCNGKPNKLPKSKCSARSVI